MLRAAPAHVHTFNKWQQCGKDASAVPKQAERGASCTTISKKR